MAIVSPIGFVRAAVKTQLADAATGLNPNLVTYCAVYGVPAWSFNFSASSLNFFEANIDYQKSEESGIPQPNMLALYGARAAAFPESERMMYVSFSGTVEITADMYIGILGEKIANFDGYVDAATAAMLATMNNVQNQNGLNAADSATRSGKVYKMDLSASPGRCQMDGENWIIPVRFGMAFGVVIP
jgi:hypothetical protein